jgi:hypothetical protein
MKPKAQAAKIPCATLAYLPLNIKKRGMVKEDKRYFLHGLGMPWEEAEKALSSSSAIFGVRT